LYRQEVCGRAHRRYASGKHGDKGQWHHKIRYFLSCVVSPILDNWYHHCDQRRIVKNSAKRAHGERDSKHGYASARGSSQSIAHETVERFSFVDGFRDDAEDSHGDDAGIGKTRQQLVDGDNSQ
jgi:hypothetical protein